MTDAPKTNILLEFKERREQVIAKLRNREPELTAELVQWNSVIGALEAEAGRAVLREEYTHFRKPSEAIHAYLRRIQLPQPRRTIAKALVDGGYARESQRPFWDVIDAIKYQLDVEQLKEVNGLVGEVDWPEDIFVSGSGT
jgi:hypothetical protein